MLWPDDQILIDHDRALPGLRLVLDPEALAELLRSRVRGVQIERAHMSYVRYKPATSCLVSIRLDTSAGPIDLYAAAYPPDQTDKLHKGTTDALPSRLGPGAIVLHDHSVALHMFPNDVRLGSLRLLAEQHSRTELLQKLFRSRPDLWRAALDRLAYKPQRRFVALLRIDAQPQAVLKFHTHASYGIATRNSKLLGSTGALALPRRIGRSARRSIAAYRWIDGRSLGAVESLDPSELHRIGAALSELHRQDAPELPLIDLPVEASRLRAMAAAVAALLPSLRQRARTIVSRLIDSYPEPRIITTIHGDFHAKQVLLRDRSVALLDLDEAARSSPAADLGNFIAHLHRHTLSSEEHHPAVARAGDALLDGYRHATRMPDEHEIRWHSAAALMRLTPHLFRAREPQWARRTAVMLDRIERILDELATVPARHPYDHIAIVEDPFNARADQRLGPFVSAALDASLVGERLGMRIESARILRHRPTRRCVIEYAAQLGGEAHRKTVGIVGKVRARGADLKTFALLRELRRRGFDDDAPDGIRVPEPLAAVPEAHLWLQRKVAGTSAQNLLHRPDASRLAARIADALVKLHRADIPTRRHHTINDEMRILHDRLGEVAQVHPQWRGRINDLLAAGSALASTLSPARTCGIHRDFYADHILVDGSKLWLIDFDLFCQGDPALDAGNFIGHLKEQALRESGDPTKLDDVCGAFEDRFIELSGESRRPSVAIYSILTLLRHIAISTRIESRRHLTARIIDLCEHALGPQMVA